MPIDTKEFLEALLRPYYTHNMSTCTCNSILCEPHYCLMLRYQGPPTFQHATLKSWEGPGDKANLEGLSFFFLFLAHTDLQIFCSRIMCTFKKKMHAYYVRFDDTTCTI